MTIVPGASAVAKSTSLRRSARWKAGDVDRRQHALAVGARRVDGDELGVGRRRRRLAATSASAGAGAATTAAGSAAPRRLVPSRPAGIRETISADASSAAYRRGDMTKHPLQLQVTQNCTTGKRDCRPPAGGQRRPRPCIAPKGLPVSEPSGAALEHRLAGNRVGHAEAVAEILELAAVPSSAATIAGRAATSASIPVHRPMRQSPARRSARRRSSSSPRAAAARARRRRTRRSDRLRRIRTTL